MADPTPANIDLPEVMHEPDEETEWYVEGVTVTLEVKRVPVDGDMTKGDATSMSYPLEAVESKLEHGDLEPGAVSSDEESGETDEWTCATCGSVYPTQQAYAGHQPCAESSEAEEG